MSTYSNLLQPALQNLLCVLFGSSTQDRHARRRINQQTFR